MEMQCVKIPRNPDICDVVFTQLDSSFLEFKFTCRVAHIRCCCPRLWLLILHGSNRLSTSRPGLHHDVRSANETTCVCGFRQSGINIWNTHSCGKVRQPKIWDSSSMWCVLSHAISRLEVWQHCCQYDPLQRNSCASEYMGFAVHSQPDMQIGKEAGLSDGKFLLTLKLPPCFLHQLASVKDEVHHIKRDLPPTLGEAAVGTSQLCNRSHVLHQQAEAGEGKCIARSRQIGMAREHAVCPSCHIRHCLHIKNTERPLLGSSVCSLSCVEGGFVCLAGRALSASMKGLPPLN